MTPDYTWSLLAGWRALPADHPDAFGDGERAEQLRARGYMKWDESCTAVASMEIWTHDGHPRFPYICFVTLPGDRFLVVWVPDDVSILEFYRCYGSTGELGRLRSEVEMLTESVRKLFRAWHGHEYYNACGACDPEQHARFRELRQRAAGGAAI